MIEEVAKAGFYPSPGWNKDYLRIQILTVYEILNGKTVNLPLNLENFKQAERIVEAEKIKECWSFEDG